MVPTLLNSMFCDGFRLIDRRAYMPVLRRDQAPWSAQHAAEAQSHGGGGHVRLKRFTLNLRRSVQKRRAK